MRQIKPLSETLIKNAKAEAKPKNLFDGGGLYLLIQPSGSKLWRFKYRFEGTPKLMSMGKYPDIGLKEARAKREEARKLLASGVDPSENRRATKAGKQERAANSFEVIAREWLSVRAASVSQGHVTRIQRQLEADIFPYIGGKPIADIKSPDVLEVLRRIQSRGAIETAHRARSNVSQIFRYAGATGRVESDPCWNLSGALKAVVVKHHAAIIDPPKFAELIRAIDGYKGGIIVKSAFQLAPLLMVRHGELRHMCWTQIDFNKGQWCFVASKTHSDFIVPLASQAINILRDLHPLTGHGKYVFPSPRTPDGSRCISENAILVALRSLGYSGDEMTVHGFRASARTILDERLKFPSNYIEAQLAHQVIDTLGRAYNRTSYLDDRRAMMQAWANYIDELKAGGSE